MTNQTKAGLFITGSTILWLALFWTNGEWRGYPILGGMLFGNVAMWLAFLVAKREDRLQAERARLGGTRRRGLIALLMMLAANAKALFLLLAVIAIGGLIVANIGVAIWSKALSVKLNQLRKPVVLAMNSVTDPGFAIAAVGGVAAAAPLEPEPEPGFVPANADQATGIALSILVPANAYLEYSTDMVTWSEIHHSGPSDEMTFWETPGSHGFFRLKSYNDNPPPTAAEPVEALLPAAQQ